MKFWFHYNKPASKKAGENRWSLHFDGACHIVKSISCDATIQTRNRKRQPRAVMAGSAKHITIENGHAEILGP